MSLVTGSARGLGAQLARRLAAGGDQLAIHYRSSAAAAQSLAGEITEAGGRAEIFQADLASSAEARSLVAAVANHFGRLDRLVYNVGPFLTTPFTALSDQEWDAILNTNVKSAWAAAIEAEPWLRQSPGGGHIIHIAANSAYVRTHSIYGLAKAALIHLTEALAVEMGPDITVNCVAPGMIEGSEPDAAVRSLVMDRTPLRRLVTASEIAEVCALLCSPAFSSVTGRTIVMDGGRWLR